jgi:hypothetical protein
MSIAFISDTALFMLNKFEKQSFKMSFFNVFSIDVYKINFKNSATGESA